MPTLSAAERERILSDELLRPPFPGLRLFSPGILRHGRTIGLSAAQVKSAPVDEARAARELVAIAWLLDLRHSLAELDRVAAQGPAFLDSTELQEYEFSLPLALLAGVKEEMAKTQAAMAAVSFEVEPKPSSGDVPQPSGKSSSQPS